MNKRRWIYSLILAATAAAATGTNLLADDTNNVDQRIDTLEREIQELKQQRELDHQEQQAALTNLAFSAPQPTNAAFVTAGADGFRVRSANSNFVLRVGGYAQADGR